MKRFLIMVAGVIGSLVGLGFVFPAVAEARAHGVLPATGVFLLIAGILLIQISVLGSWFAMRKLSRG